MSGALPRRTVVATMAGVVAAMLMAALDGTIVGTAMPAIVRDLRGLEHYAAVTTVYLLASTVVVPIVGKLSDQFGRKPFLLVGVAIFVVASALCAQASSMTELVIWRGLQGLGAGFSQSTSFTVIADLFPPARRGKVSGMMGAIFGVASVLGPALGGFLTDGPGWRWCFAVNVPVGVVAFTVLWVAFPAAAQARASSARVDWAGAAFLVAGVVPLLSALSWGGREAAWGSPAILALLATAVLMLAAFFVVERRAPEAILPPSLFRDRVVWTSALAATLTSTGLFAASMFIPLFIQGVVGGSATKSGAALTPMMLAMIAASVTCGQIVTRTGKYKAVAVVGVSTTAFGLWLLSRMDASTTYGVVVRDMLVVGAGLGATMPVFTLAVQNVVSPTQVGVATSSIQFLRAMGGSIGVAAFGAMLASGATAGRAALAASLHDVFLAAAVVVAGAALVTTLLRDVPLRTTNAAPPAE